MRNRGHLKRLALKNQVKLTLRKLSDADIIKEMDDMGLGLEDQPANYEATIQPKDKPQ